MLVKVDPRPRRPLIDLTGPEGNVFVLMGYARTYAKQLKKDGNSIITKMMSGDYKNAVDVFEEEFGDYVDLYVGNIFEE